MRELRFFISCNPATPDSVDAFERQMEITLPGDFREFLLEYNGGCLEAENDFYPVPSRFQRYMDEYGHPGEPGISVQDVFGISSRTSRFSITEESRRLQAIGSLPEGSIPVASDGCGNSVILWVGNETEHGLSFLDHETGEEFQIADSCTEFFNGLKQQDHGEL